MKGPGPFSTPPSAVARSGLLKAGLFGGVVRRLLKAGLVHRHEEYLLIAGLIDEPLLGTIDAYIAWLVPSRWRQPYLLARTAQAAVRTWPFVDRLLIRGPAAPDIARQEWLIPRVRYMSKQPMSYAAGRNADTADVAFRSATSGEEWLFVQRLLADALVDGYASAGHHIELATALSYAQSTFHPSLTGNVRAVVVYRNGRMIGHATWLLDVEDGLNEAATDELVDVVVDKSFAGRGYGSRLVTFVEDTLAPRRRRLLGNVTMGGETDRSVRVIDELQHTGWRDEYQAWQADVRLIR